MSSEHSPFDDEFDTLVKDQLEKWKVPGLSIAIIHGPTTYTKVIPPIHLIHYMLTEYRHLERQSCLSTAQVDHLGR